MFDDDPTLVEGEMTVSSSGRVNRGTPGQADFNTLDEPIKETFVSETAADDDPKMSWQNKIPSNFSFVMSAPSAASSSTCCTRRRRTTC